MQGDRAGHAEAAGLRYIPYAELDDVQRAVVDGDHMFSESAELGWGLDWVFESRFAGSYANVASSPYCTPELLAAIAELNNALVLEAVAGNPSCPPEVLARLSVNSRSAVRDAVAENPSTPATVLADMVENPDCSSWGAWKSERGHAVYLCTCRLVAENPSCPPHTKSLVEKRRRQRCGDGICLLYDELDRWQRQDLDMAVSGGRLHYARKGLGLDRLAADPDPHVRCEVARNPNCPPNILSILADDADPDVRAAAFSNSSCPVDVPTAFLKGCSARQRAAMASDTGSPRLLGLLAADRSVGVRCAVAANLHTPAEAVARLCSDPGLKVRRTAALYLSDRPDIPPSSLGSILAALAFDGDPEVRACAASHPACQHAQLESLSRDADPDVRASVANSPSAAPELLAALACDADSQVRAAVAGNPASDDKLLAILADDPDGWVSREALCAQAKRSTS